MSLINDMLRELDRRGAAPPLLPGIAASAITPRRVRHPVLLAVLAVLAVGALLASGVLWWHHASVTAQSSRAPASTEVPPAAHADVGADDGAAGYDSAAVALADATDVPTPPPTDTAFKRNTSRPSDSTSGPGMDAVAVRVSDAGSARVETAPLHAPTDAASARNPRPEPGDRPPTAASGEPARGLSPADRHNATIAAPPRHPTDAPITVGHGPAPADPTAALARSPADTTDADRPVTAEPGMIQPGSIEIRRRTPLGSAARGDVADLIRRAELASAAQRGDDAEQLLRQALASAPMEHRARHALARMLADGGRRDEATRLLEDGLRLDPAASALAELLGRWWLEAGDPVRATAVLAGALPPLAQRPAHHALLASAWQQAGDPARAAAIWRALLQHDPTSGSAWLGLALAEDALGRRDAAVDAYARARRDRTLGDAVLRYIEQRMRDLGADRR